MDNGAIRKPTLDGANEVADNLTMPTLPWGGDTSDHHGEFVASVAFLRIADFAKLDGPRCVAAMTTLHEIIRDTLVERDARGLRVLGVLGGAVLVSPDAEVRALDTITSLCPIFWGKQLAVRIGLASGPACLRTDADGTFNIIGRCANTAARLANARENTGLLVDLTFANHLKGALPAEHWLSFRKRDYAGKTVTGKRGENFRCFSSPEPTHQGIPGTKIEAARDVPQNAVLLAYDLPSFSDGDFQALISRFDSVSKVVSSTLIGHTSQKYFSLGGDGGVVALMGARQREALSIGEALAQALEVESSLKAPRAGANARVAIHYGPVYLYKSAENAPRPTGLAIVEADELAGDEAARKYASIIVSDALIDAASLGSAIALQRDFT